MSAAPTIPVAHAIAPTDAELVAGVRTGDDTCFEELYRRYQRRIVTFVRRLVRDDARAEDVTQEAFLSALRRLRATDSEIAFKPWIYEIARNASIDLYRRTSRAEEISMEHDDLMRPADRIRLVGGLAPDSALLDKERFDHLRGALDELSETHHRIIVMRELEGLSYREIGDRLELSRPAVESTLFRARRRLEREYEEIEAGRRCETTAQAIARLAEGIESRTDRRRLERHVLRCSACRRRARELGVEPLRRRGLGRVAALLPLPRLLRRRESETADVGGSPDAKVSGLLNFLAGPGAHFGGALSEQVATLVTAVALAGAGGAALNGTGAFDDDGGLRDRLQGDQLVTPLPELRAHPPAPRLVAPGRAAPERIPAAPERPYAAPKPSSSPRAEQTGPGGRTGVVPPNAEVPGAPSLPSAPAFPPFDAPTLPPVEPQQTPRAEVEPHGVAVPNTATAARPGVESASPALPAATPPPQPPALPST